MLALVLASLMKTRLKKRRHSQVKLEDLGSLSLNYWLTKLVQKVANENGGRYEKFRNCFELHCKRNVNSKQ